MRHGYGGALIESVAANVIDAALICADLIRKRSTLDMVHGS
jgi:hypothetical protein